MWSVLHVAPLRANSFNENINQLIFMTIEDHCYCIFFINFYLSNNYHCRNIENILEQKIKSHPASYCPWVITASPVLSFLCCVCAQMCAFLHVCICMCVFLITSGTTYWYNFMFTFFHPVNSWQLGVCVPWTVFMHMHAQCEM